MKEMKNIRKLIVIPMVMVVASCQQGPPPGGSVGVRNYSDAVVHIGQVDPAYRAYFQGQNAANYSLSDQRRAYVAAAQTARTPVRASDYRPGNTRRIASRGKKRTKAKVRVARARSGGVSRNALAVRRRTDRRR